MRKKSHSKPSHRETRGPSQRQLRAGELVRRALAEIIARGTIQDPELAERAVTISEVRMSPDLKQATCFVAPLGGGDSKAIVAGLTRVKSYLRGQLAHEVTFKFMPDLVFMADTSFDRAEAVDRLLHSPSVARDLQHDDTDED
ncbi:MAG: 30S ribosome-binding factor RbfA [Parvibaculum sp.]|jgi:ribosome-binding factor A|uniref:30S ribosome-binding factor RbfA n=1 Tax=Parvibaculum sp. TaxID=2024848 RepID=UPI00284AB939|nr:30S ribosome-binding factor RbfA [Parvibaculum sp.]MDR3500741.1 30S ribosome-binding factor RbfA [Parvibaculum sp.]